MMPRRALATYAGLLLLGAAAAGVALLVGRGDLGDPVHGGTFLRLRAARAAAAFMAGAGLAVGGVLVQGLFRNPLASPSILGTTAGAALGGQLALVIGGASWAVGGAVAPEMLLPLGCIGGALASLALLLAFVRRGAGILTLLLTGFVLSSLFLAMGSFLLSLAQENFELGRAVVAFSLGGVGGTGTAQVLLALPLVVGGSIAAWGWGGTLDVLLSGEDEAASLGVDVDQVRRWCVAWTALVTAGAVCLGGGVGFVGLVVPHALRPLVGVGHRRLVAASFLGGGAFLLLCDVGVRAAPTQSEVPLGVLTGLVGAPLFLFILRRLHREGLYG